MWLCETIGIDCETIDIGGWGGGVGRRGDMNRYYENNKKTQYSVSRKFHFVH